MAFRGIGSLDEAAHMVDLVAHPNLTICIDVLHHFRSGGTVASVSNLDASAVSCVQLCDALAIAPPLAELPREARYGRLELGEGDLPLRDLLMVVPAGVPLAIEIPSVERARYVDNRACGGTESVRTCAAVDDTEGKCLMFPGLSNQFRLINFGDWV